MTLSLRSRAGLLLGGLALFNLAAWAFAFAVFADRPTLIATALLAWTFGLRHAVDADHIAAIDNVTRKLMARGDKPLAAGLFFSLGHSTIVVAASTLLALAAATYGPRLNAFKSFGGLIGTAVSGLFLLIIGLTNLIVLIGLWRRFRQMAAGGDAEDLDALLAGRGLFARLLRPLFALVSASWQLYFVGFLFGLGFDTATEIGLLGISAQQGAAGLDPIMIMVFPALFAAGMALVDSADSVMMVGAYGFAQTDPLKKLWYNLTVTAVSVIVALFIGGVEILGLIGDRLALDGGFWRMIGALNDDLENFGFFAIGLFAAAWAISALIYRRAGYRKLETA